MVVLKVFGGSISNFGWKKKQPSCIWFFFACFHAGRAGPTRPPSYPIKPQVNRLTDFLKKIPNCEHFSLEPKKLSAPLAPDLASSGWSSCSLAIQPGGSNGPRAPMPERRSDRLRERGCPDGLIALQDETAQTRGALEPKTTQKCHFGHF